MQQPTIGRVVHFNLGPTRGGIPAVWRPAMVVNVNSDGTVDLHVHVINTDGLVLDAPWSELVSAPIFVRSCVKQGEEPGEWRWPPRVG
jgi:hypothetical protein